jgi:hypothetical protein
MRWAGLRVLTFLCFTLVASGGCRVDESWIVDGVPDAGRGGAGGVKVTGTGGTPGSGGASGTGAGGALGVDAQLPPGTGSGTGGRALPADASLTDTNIAADGPATIDVGEPPAPGDAAAAVDLAPVGQGLVGHWRLDQAEGTTVRDSSGSGNDGVLTGGAALVSPAFPLAKFPNGAALSLDGVDDQVVARANRLPAADAPKTISVWVRFSSQPAASQAAVSLTTRASSCGVHLGRRGAILAAWLWGGEVLAMVSAPGAGWHHMLYTFDGGHHSLSVDGGAPVSSNLPPQSCAITDVVIGNYQGGGNWFPGNIDDVRVYNRALETSEARQLAEGLDLGAP